MSQHQPSSNGEVAYIHAYAGLTEDQLLERREWFKELYYQKLDELEAIDVSIGAISQLIRDRRQIARETGEEAI